MTDALIFSRQSRVPEAAKACLPPSHVSAAFPGRGSSSEGDVHEEEPQVQERPNWPPPCPSCGARLALSPQIDSSGATVKGYSCPPCDREFTWKSLQAGSVDGC